jgi:hypothetical protein
MAELTPKLRSVTTGHAHWCPGCEQMHMLPNRWHFNDNVQEPTFSPSFRHDWGGDRVCHYFVAGGRLQFCADSTHALAGQTVDMPDIPTTETLGTAGAE